MSRNQDLPIWAQEREEVLKQDKGVQWRDGQRPDYSHTNAFLEQERQCNHAEGSLNAIAHNLVRTFEMEASFKTNPQQWLSVVTDKFRMSTNGGQEYTAQDIVEQGTYNLFLEDSEHYQARNETFESSYNLFHTAFPNGFHWELIEVVAPPPNVVFKWRHWGTFTGAYKKYQPTGETIVSGIVLLIDTPFQFGDVLRLEDGSLGMLKKIGVRVTQLYMFIWLR